MKSYRLVDSRSSQSYDYLTARLLGVRFYLQKLIRFSRRELRILFEDPLFYWMKFISRFIFLRNLAARRNKACDSFIVNLNAKRAEVDSAPVKADVSPGKIAALMESDGYFQGLRLAPTAIDSILEFAGSNTCYANQNSNCGFNIHQLQDFRESFRGELKVASFKSPYKNCKTIADIVGDPLILEVAARYLGSPPVFLRAGLKYTFPCRATEADLIANAQVLHCDINDYKTVKVFFYISDVDLDSGPHIYLQGTHRDRRFRHQLLGQRCASVPDKALLETYGYHRLKTVCGEAGFGFACDPYTLHKGTVPRRHTRLMLQLEFGINTYKTWYFS